MTKPFYFKIKSDLNFLEEKLINNLDYRYLHSVSSHFPTNNAYFLVCFVEIINDLSNKIEDKDIIKDIFSAIGEYKGSETLLKYCIKKTLIVYNNTNVSNTLHLQERGRVE